MVGHIEREMTHHIVSFGSEERRGEKREEERSAIGPCGVVAGVDETGSSGEVELLRDD
jgi:hypothetical protein